MKNLIWVLVFICNLGCTAEVEVKSNRIFQIKGNIDSQKLQEFKAALILNSEIKEIEFINSGSISIKGDDAEALKEFKRLINTNKLVTSARGLCLGSCALLFLTGYERTLKEGIRTRQTRLLLHPLMTENNEFLEEETNSFFEDIVKRSENKIPLDLLKRLYEVHDEFGGIAIMKLAIPGNSHVFFSSRIGEKPGKLEFQTPEDYGIKVEK
ncbi:hypothetical protein [Undibacterium sp. TC9W]|jgi:hypothetical protein|uniref:hypothetical protein n=1 Tax=Undibacterium sp. TC9W TaxID=3413053 RepID=UPI003BF3B15C